MVGDNRLLIWYERLWRRPALVLALAALASGLLAMGRISRFILVAGLLALVKRIVLPDHRKTVLIRHPWRVISLILCVFFGSWRLGLPIARDRAFQNRYPDGAWSGEVTVVQILSENHKDQPSATAVVRTSSGARLALTGPADILRPGAHLKVQGRLSRPAQAVNPGGFDRQKWLRQTGVLQEIAAGEATVSLLRAGRPHKMENLAANWRQMLREGLCLLVGTERAPLLEGLLIGSTTALSQETRYFFVRPDCRI
jgi:predicted membrane metal-binding protein